MAAPRLAWQALASQPAQSLEAYFESSLGALPDDVVDQFSRCTSAAVVNSAVQRYFEHDRPISAAFAFYRVDGSRVHHCVLAHRDIAANEVVGFVGGQLLTMERAEQEGAAYHPHIVLSNESMQSAFNGITGSMPGLVLSMQTHTNALSYASGIPPASDFFAADTNARVVLHLVVYKTGKRKRVRLCLPFAVVVATTGIEAGAEIRLRSTPNPFWISNHHRTLDALARFNHAYHIYADTLEAVLDDAPLPRFRYGVEAPPMRRATEWAWTMDRTKSNAATEPLISRPVPLAEAFERSGCEHEERSFTPDDDLRRRITGALASTNHRISIHTLPRRARLNRAADPDDVEIADAEVRDIIEREYLADALEVREVLSYCHPARFYSPPNVRAYCVSATRRIPKHTLVANYTGQLQTNNATSRENAHTAYAYSIPVDELNVLLPGCGTGKHGRWTESLCIDAEKHGGVARFINDHNFRDTSINEAAVFQRARTVNCDVLYAFHDSMFHALVFTIREIANGEELLLDYSDVYWLNHIGVIIAEHQLFMSAIVDYVEQLRSMLSPDHYPYRDLPTRIIFPAFTPSDDRYRAARSLSPPRAVRHAQTEPASLTPTTDDDLELMPPPPPRKRPASRSSSISVTFVGIAAMRSSSDDGREFQLRMGDGRLVWVHEHGFPYPDAIRQFLEANKHVE